MFSQSKALAAAVDAIVSQTEQPVPGTIIRSLRGLPIRIHCQVKRMEREDETTPPEIFAYATVVPLRPGLIVSNVKHYAHDFGSQDFHGTKAVLLSNSRIKALRQAATDEILRTSDVLPAMALKVVAATASGRALKVEIVEYCSNDVIERCAGLVYAYRRIDEVREANGTAAAIKEAEDFAKASLTDFYLSFEEGPAATAEAEAAEAAKAAKATMVDLVPSASDTEIEIPGNTVPAEGASAL